MPIYEYVCRKCGKTFEYMQRMSDSPKRKCESCGAQALERLISQTSFQLKGSGWYKDLYSSPKPSGAASKGDGASDSAAGKSSGSGADSAAGSGSGSGSGTGTGSGSGSGSEKSAGSDKPGEKSGKKAKKGSP